MGTVAAGEFYWQQIYLDLMLYFSDIDMPTEDNTPPADGTPVEEPNQVATTPPGPDGKVH
jgi:hypothetical protein